MMEQISRSNLNQWYVNLLSVDYYTLVETLNRYHGRVRNNYFTDPTCEFRTKEISRTREGLCVHHVDEDKEPGLSTREFAINSLWEYQLANRLVYCDLLEHLILHIKIYESSKKAGGYFKLGINGAKKIMRQIDAFYCGEAPENLGEWNLLQAISRLRNEYLYILDYARKIGITYEPETLRIPYKPPIYRVHSELPKPLSNNWIRWVLALVFVIILVIILSSLPRSG